MVTILISAAFRGAVLIRGGESIRGRRLFQCGNPKVQRLFETWRLLEEICYLFIYLFIYLFVCLFVCLFICLFIYLFTYLFIYLFIYLYSFTSFKIEKKIFLNLN